MTKTKWKLDLTHSELAFRIKHLMISHVPGSFRNFDAEVQTESDDFSAAEIRVTADITSISTSNEQRDQHLRASDFFEAEKYPQLTFQSTRIEKESDDTFYLHGELTMKGVTRLVKLSVEFNGITRDPWGGERAGFSFTGKLNRSDWGIQFNSTLETGGLMLGEEVKVHGEIQLVKQAVAVAA
jgi:polyisoprenoid-binding protein YceI